MDECIICCRLNESAELYSAQSGQLIQTLSRPNSNSSPTNLPPAYAFLNSINQSNPILARVSSNPTRSGLSLTSLSSSLTEQRFIPPVLLSCVALSGGGSFIAGGTNQGSILVWELDSGTLLQTIDGHYQPITQLEFTPDEGALISASKDGAITVWDTNK
jgi:pre-rRNA-processing protein IPI3